ncbi:MAG: TetR/AcrR family transcriptional regulator [Deltaproteobacteria bacterium]|nr:TetR/AcrR family transcriptional regulator [Deltaproteobacteria bacterium]
MKSKSNALAPLSRGSAAQATRQLVLEAAEELIRTEGLEALSFREVSRRAGLSHQAPYHYFPDREAILAALANQGFALLAEKLREARRSRPTPLARLEACGNAYVDLALSRPAHFKLMFRPEMVKLDDFPDTAAFADSAFQELQATVREVLEAGHGVPEEEPVLTALCWSVVHGLAGLLLDGPLLYKLGRSGSGQLVPLVMAMMCGLVEGRTAGVRRGRTKGARGAAARTR